MKYTPQQKKKIKEKEAKKCVPHLEIKDGFYIVESKINK